MPCDSITTQRVNLSNAHGAVLKAALEALGFTINEYMDTSISARMGGTVFSWEKGQQAVVRGNYDTSLITKQYSKSAVTYAAQRAGWAVKQVGEKLQIQRRV